MFKSTSLTPITAVALILIDTATPTGSLALNNNASTSHTVLVYANSTASDAISGIAYMRLRDVSGAWTSWLPYATSTLWQLPGVTGQNYTVEIQFKDRAGNQSAVYQDAIALNIYPARPASPGYRLVRSTWGAAPSNGQSANYWLLGTLGQPSMIGLPASANYRLSSGYWMVEGEGYAIYLPVVLRQSP